MAKKQGSAAKFQRPEDIPLDEKMVPVSARIPESISKRLSKESDRSGHPVSKLIDHALRAYVTFLEEGKE